MRPDGSMPPQTGEGADEVAVDGILAIGEHGERLSGLLSQLSSCYAAV